MVSFVKDYDSKIIAFIEWRLVGPSGHEVPSGEFVWVNDIWVHPNFRHTNRIGRMIDEVMRAVPHAKYCYFQRKEYNRKLRIHTRSQFNRRRLIYDKLMIGD